MKTVIVIPARYASTRFNGKPLAQIKGATGISKSLIQRSWEAARAVPDITELFVATDDTRIADHAAGFGAKVLMTSNTARNGTERCAEALAQLSEQPDLLVNFQGDAPLTPAGFVTNLIAKMARSNAAMATPVLRCDAQTLAQFQQDRKAGRVGGTTAVFDATNRALYFSKEVLPYADNLATTPQSVFHHVGLYAFRPEALRQYLSWPEGRLEQIEGLEQLRFLENGAAIDCVEVSAADRHFWEVNNPVDVARVESVLSKIGVE